EYGDKSIPDFFSVDAWDGMAAIYGLVKETKGNFTADQAMAFLSHWKDPDSPRGPIMIDPETRDVVQNGIAAGGSAIPRISPYVARVSFTLWQQGYPIGKWAA